jgi:hypothetical protein
LQHIEWGHLKLLRGPVVTASTVADRQGMLNESESILNGKPVYSIGTRLSSRLFDEQSALVPSSSAFADARISHAAFYLPWGAAGSLEVSVVTQQGNHEEARQRLVAIVSSLESRP